MYLFFDTETTGTPKNYKAPVSDLNNWPRVIQFAWAVYDSKYNLVKSQCDLIKPEGWSMPTDKFWIENGFTHEKNVQLGIPIKSALIHFLAAMNQCPYLVAHNIAFDTPIVQAEMIRAELTTTHRPSKICTMDHGTQVCRIPGTRGGYKWPKLLELHQHLFNKGFDNAHDALADVKACAACFFEMVRLGHIPLITRPVEVPRA